MAELTLTLNGEPRRIATGATVADLFAALGIEPRHVAVERNRAIVPRSTFGEARLADGDRIELVQFVGGG